MIKFTSLEFLGLSHRILGKIKKAVYSLEISALVLEIFKFEMCVKYANGGLITSFNQPNITSSV